jgi:hypothetical protein
VKIQNAKFMHMVIIQCSLSEEMRCKDVDTNAFRMHMSSFLFTAVCCTSRWGVDIMNLYLHCISDHQPKLFEIMSLKDMGTTDMYEMLFKGIKLILEEWVITTRILRFIN